MELKQRLHIAVVIWVSILALISCNNKEEIQALPENTFPDETDVDLHYTENPRAFALKFYDFIGDGAENIKRLDSDTTRIEINEGLLTYLQISELKAGDALNTWENIDRPPYIRVVDAVERSASGNIVTTHAGNIGDLFHSIEGCFDTELFSDISDRPDRPDTRSGNMSDDYQYIDSEEDFVQFVDDDGKIHPFITYSQSKENPDVYEYQLAEHEYDEMIDSMLATKLSPWSTTWHIIDSKTEHINIYPKRDENSYPIGIFVADASVEFKADMEIYFQFNITTSNRFWAKMSGGVKIDAPIHLRFAGKQLQAEKEIPVFEFTPIFTAFAIGPFVIPVVIRNGFIFKYYGSINANLSMMIPFYYNASFETGPVYDEGKWSYFHEFDWNAGINYDKLTVLPAANLSLEAGTGFYFHTGAYLGSAVGPFFEIGPQAKVAANAALSGNEVFFNTKGELSIGGNIGAEIKVWKFDLGKVKFPYTVASKELWNFDLRFQQEDIINSMGGND